MIKGEVVKTMVSVCVLLGIMFGAITYFATAKDVELVAMRLDQKILSDQIIAISQRMWQLEDRYPGQPNCSTWRGPNASRDAKEYRQLKLQLEELKRRQQKGK